MYASLGFCFPECFKFPSFRYPASVSALTFVTHGFNALSQVPAAGWTLPILCFGLYELPSAFKGRLAMLVAYAQRPSLELGFPRSSCAWKWARRDRVCDSHEELPHRLVVDLSSVTQCSGGRGPR